MKRSWTALAVAAVAVLAVAGCNDYGNTFQNNTGATILSISPSVISAGQVNDFTLTVNGGTFVKGTVVQWNGQTLVTTLPIDSAGNILGSIATATVPKALVAKPGLATIITLSPTTAPQPMVFPTQSRSSSIHGESATGFDQYHSQHCRCRGATTSLSLTGSSFLSSSDATQASQVNWTSEPRPRS